MKFEVRSLHRDLGYFFIGLIISFAFSGILQNHRQTWHPEKYTVEVKPFTLVLKTNFADIPSKKEN
jgi:uncharacterized protein